MPQDVFGELPSNACESEAQNNKGLDLDYCSRRDREGGNNCFSNGARALFFLSAGAVDARADQHQLRMGGAARGVSLFVSKGV